LRGRLRRAAVHNRILHNRILRSGFGEPPGTD
jgi:hypothetical protein